MVIDGHAAHHRHLTTHCPVCMIAFPKLCRVTLVKTAEKSQRKQTRADGEFSSMLINRGASGPIEGPLVAEIVAQHKHHMAASGKSKA